MAAKKLLFAVFVISSWFFPSIAYADAVPLECMPLQPGITPPPYCMYGRYKGPLYPFPSGLGILIGLGANFALVLATIVLLDHLHFKKIRGKSLFYAIAITLGGLLVDSAALFIANRVHGHYYDQFIYSTDFLKNCFFNSLFLSSFLLLTVVYTATFSLIYKKKPSWDIIIVSLLLALINNPYWSLKYF